MKKLSKFILPALFLVACGGSVEVDPNMKAFMDEISKTNSMMDAISKYGANPDMETDLDLYEIKEPTVSSVADKSGKKCYMMNVKHGILDSNCEVCWSGDKVESVTYVES